MQELVNESGALEQPLRDIQAGEIAPIEDGRFTDQKRTITLTGTKTLKPA